MYVAGAGRHSVTKSDIERSRCSNTALVEDDRPSQVVNNQQSEAAERSSCKGSMAAKVLGWGRGEGFNQSELSNVSSPTILHFGLV